MVAYSHEVGSAVFFLLGSVFVSTQVSHAVFLFSGFPHCAAAYLDECFLYAGGCLVAVFFFEY